MIGFVAADYTPVFSVLSMAPSTMSYKIQPENPQGQTGILRHSDLQVKWTKYIKGIINSEAPDTYKIMSHTTRLQHTLAEDMDKC